MADGKKASPYLAEDVGELTVANKQDLLKILDDVQYKTVMLCYVCSPCALEFPGEGNLAKADLFCGGQGVQHCCCCRGASRCQCSEVAMEKMCFKNKAGGPCFEDGFITCIDDVEKCMCFSCAVALPPTKDVPLACVCFGKQLWDPADKYGDSK